MSSTPTYYMKMCPKRGDITGSYDQVFGKGEDFYSYLIGGIKANTIAAIGTIASGTSIVQYLFVPKIYHDLGGTPIMISETRRTS